MSNPSTSVSGDNASGRCATEVEIASQPDVWERLIGEDTTRGSRMIGKGRALVVGCGTSAFVAQAIASLRESAGFGETDAAFASEVLADRAYDHVLAISRSATTTEVLEALARLTHVGSRVGVTAVDGAIAVAYNSLFDDVVVLREADEISVIQTRFPTSILALPTVVVGCAGALGNPAAS